MVVVVGSCVVGGNVVLNSVVATSSGVNVVLILVVPADVVVGPIKDEEVGTEWLISTC